MRDLQRMICLFVINFYVQSLLQEATLRVHFSQDWNFSRNKYLFFLLLTFKINRVQTQFDPAASPRDGRGSTHREIDENHRSFQKTEWSRYQHSNTANASRHQQISMSAQHHHQRVETSGTSAPQDRQSVDTSTINTNTTTLPTRGDINRSARQHRQRVEISTITPLTRRHQHVRAPTLRDINPSTLQHCQRVETALRTRRESNTSTQRHCQRVETATLPTRGDISASHHLHCQRVEKQHT